MANVLKYHSFAKLSFKYLRTLSSVKVTLSLQRLNFENFSDMEHLKKLFFRLLFKDVVVVL